MKWNKPLVFALLCCLVAGPLGCRQKVASSNDKNDAAGSTQSTSSANDAIAVIDLNVVAEEIGARQKINDSLRVRETELSNQLSSFQEDLEGKLEAYRSGLSAESSEQDKAKLNEMLLQNRSLVAKQAQAAQAQLAGYHASLNQTLFDQVRPVAFQVARSRGLSIVMTTNQVYAASPERDITHQVVEEIQRLNSTGEAAVSAVVEAPETRVAELPGGGQFMPH